MSASRAGFVALMVGLAGCPQDVSFTENAQCDGELQPAEDTVDDAFDADGDGFFDEANTQCAETYAPEDLDCNDGDDLVHPGAAEECDEIDNDCDGETDEDCISDSYSGDWFITPGVTYYCASNLVSVNFTTLSVFDSSPDISIGTSGGQPGTMTGTLDEQAHFEVTNVIPGGGIGCTEQYRLTGDFDGADAFTATFEMNFQGSCFNCTYQSIAITGERVE